jgi:hypothetical protein
MRNIISCTRGSQNRRGQQGLHPGSTDDSLWLRPQALQICRKYAILNTGIRNTQYSIRNTQYAILYTLYSIRNTLYDKADYALPWFWRISLRSRTFLSDINVLLCTSCSVGPKQTPMHLLLDCKISNIRTARDKVKKELNTKNLTLPLLLGTKSGIKATIKFLEETRLATRGWRQSQDNSRHLGLEED